MAEFLTPEVKRKFGDLACRSSPENLSCDGELPRAQVRVKLLAIQREWRALEKEIGMKVTEEMAWDWELATMKATDPL